jgi:starch synthase
MLSRSKVGGRDVVGITKYQNKAGHLRVVIPCYDTKFKKKNKLNVSIGVL